MRITNLFRAPAHRISELYPPRHIRAILNQCREQDAKDNAALSPPPDERIRTISLLFAEAYPPTRQLSLVQRLQELNWFDDSEPSSVIAWLTRMRTRQSGQGFYNLGFFGKKQVFRGAECELPESVDVARAYLFQLTPGHTIIVFQFEYKADAPQLLPNALSTVHSTRVERTNKGWRFHIPESQKRTAIIAACQTRRQEAIKWVRSLLPGMFVEEGISMFPTLEVTLTQKASLADAPTSVDDYRHLLGLDTYAPISDEHFGGAIVRFSEADLSNHLFLTATDNSLLASKDITVYGGRTTQGLNNALWSELNGWFAEWSLNAVMMTYERSVARLRDTLWATSRHTTSRHHLSARVRCDAMAFTHELQCLTENCHHGTGRAREFYFCNADGTKETTREVLCRSLRDRARGLARSARLAMDAEQATSAMDGARSNDRLQKTMAALTFVGVAIAGLQLYQAISPSPSDARPAISQAPTPAAPGTEPASVARRVDTPTSARSTQRIDLPSTATKPRGDEPQRQPAPTKRQDNPGKTTPAGQTGKSNSSPAHQN
jgi:hypothetical protein